ncbi:MAG: radical SAM protein [Phycisphaerae bacterium]|nr:radical SAM protein [Phycisphaerae bacterium]
MPETPLEKNTYNAQLKRSDPKFKLWHSVGLMLTYWCPAKCTCCYLFSGPDAQDARAEMSVQMALTCWRNVRKLAGHRGKVHLTGGEPFGNYQRLKEILTTAQNEGLQGLEKIETNAYWCTSKQIIRDRLEELNTLGLTVLQISTDIYHQEYIPIERVRLAVEVATEVLGPDRVQVRWRDFMEDPVDLSNKTTAQKHDAYAAELQKRPERIVGRATEELAALLPQKKWQELAQFNCKRALLGARHVHVDGFGHVFSGTCAGIILGKIDLPTFSLEDLWLSFDYQDHPVFSILAEKGPVGLIASATEAGYHPQKNYANKCHLCFDIRRYLQQCKDSSAFLGPGICYGNLTT